MISCNVFLIKVFYASFVHHVGANLLMQHSFGGWGVEPSLAFAVKRKKLSESQKARIKNEEYLDNERKISWRMIER
jgi:hypothetical protein